MYLITIVLYYYECVAISGEMSEAPEKRADNNIDSNHQKHNVQLVMQM